MNMHYHQVKQLKYLIIKYFNCFTCGVIWGQRPSNTRKQSSDRYLDYSTTLFLAHLNQENQSSMIPYMLSHLSLHIFFNDHESFKTYLSTMNQHFNLDFSQYFIDKVKKHFQSHINKKQ